MVKPIFRQYAELWTGTSGKESVEFRVPENSDAIRVISTYKYVAYGDGIDENKFYTKSEFIIDWENKKITRIIHKPKKIKFSKQDIIYQGYFVEQGSENDKLSVHLSSHQVSHYLWTSSKEIYFPWTYGNEGLNMSFQSDSKRVANFLNLIFEDISKEDKKCLVDHTHFLRVHFARDTPKSDKYFIGEMFFLERSREYIQDFLKECFSAGKIVIEFCLFNDIGYFCTINDSKISEIVAKDIEFVEG